MESNICSVYLDIYTLDPHHCGAMWTTTWDSHIHAIILQLNPSDRHHHQLQALEAKSVSYIVNFGHPQVALHTHLTPDLATLQHQINQMSDDIVLQVQHRQRQSKKNHHKMFMQHLHEHLGHNHEADINFLFLELRRHRAVFTTCSKTKAHSFIILASRFFRCFRASHWHLRYCHVAFPLKISPTHPMFKTTTRREIPCAPFTSNSFGQNRDSSSSWPFSAVVCESFVFAQLHYFVSVAR